MLDNFHITEIGNGQVQVTDDAYTLTMPPVTEATYHDAQITSYKTRHDFQFEPPLTLTLRAHAPSQIHGTAGFGFWNHPYVRLPKAIWFFHGSPPNNMPLAKGVPGHGWKCATFDAANWRFLSLLPTAPIGFLLMRSRFFYNRLWGIGQRALGVDEHLLDEALLNAPHDYGIQWEKQRVRFSVDDKVVFETDHVPKGKLGFIAWIDNQYAIVTPQGRFGYGVLKNPSAQKIILQSISIRNFIRN